MQEIDGAYFYLFNYFPGKTLRSAQITEYHSSTIGNVLAKIHSIDKMVANEDFTEMSIDWNFYLTR